LAGVVSPDTLWDAVASPRFLGDVWQTGNAPWIASQKNRKKETAVGSPRKPNVG
jgi:hypothetical protein